MSNVKHTAFKFFQVRVHRPSAATAAAARVPRLNAREFLPPTCSARHSWNLNAPLAISTAPTTFSLDTCGVAASAMSCTTVGALLLLPFLIIRRREEEFFHERPTISFRAQALVVSEAYQTQRVWRR